LRKVKEDVTKDRRTAISPWQPGKNGRRLDGPTRAGRKQRAATAAELFPVALKLQGRECLVVGAGRVAESKIESLTRCGARVRVVAPQATEKIRAMAKAGRIAWERRRYRKSDLAGLFLVVAATSSPALHEEIFRQARRAGILCNAVDEPERCDFYYPAVVRRGPLQIAISTGGRSPSLAQRLRQELELSFPAEYGAWTEAIGRARRAVLASGRPTEERKQLLKKLSNASAFDAFRQRAKAEKAPKERA
jgi:precorrin-2 dehydrogenase / sirohydrochlorin ferrochelatase